MGPLTLAETVDVRRHGVRSSQHLRNSLEHGTETTSTVIHPQRALKHAVYAKHSIVAWRTGEPDRRS